MRATIVLICVLAGNIALAQGGTRASFDPTENAKQNSLEMKERLELSDSQFKKVEKINLDAANKMKNTYDNALGDREAMRAAMLKINEETNELLKAVLTETQWVEYEKLVKERRERMLRRQG